MHAIFIQDKRGKTYPGCKGYDRPGKGEFFGVPSCGKYEIRDF